MSNGGSESERRTTKPKVAGSTSPHKKTKINESFLKKIQGKITYFPHYQVMSNDGKESKSPTTKTYVRCFEYPQNKQKIVLTCQCFARSYKLKKCT